MMIGKIIGLLLVLSYKNLPRVSLICALMDDHSTDPGNCIYPGHSYLRFGLQVAPLIPARKRNLWRRYPSGHYKTCFTVDGNHHDEDAVLG